MKLIVIFATAIALIPSLGRTELLKCPPPRSAISIMNGIYEAQPGVVFQLHGFSGSLVPRGNRPPLCYVKETHLERGDIFVSSRSLSNIFTQKLEDARSQVQDVNIETGEGVARITGKIKKVVPLSFEIDGPVSTDGIGITIEAQKIRAEGIPIKGLLELVGTHLSSLMGGGNVNGVTVLGNRLTFNPAELAHLRGHIETAAATQAGLTLHYVAVHPARSGKQRIRQRVDSSRP